MSFQLRTSFQAAPVVPVATTAAANQMETHKTYYANPNAPQPISTPMPTTPTASPRHSLHQRVPTANSLGLESALEALNSMDFSEKWITSDISTLDCESVKADPHYNPAVEETPFVPPLEISIPVNPLQQQQQQQQPPRHRHTQSLDTSIRSSYPSAISPTNALPRPCVLARQSSCQSRLEMSQASGHHQRSKSFVSHKMAIKVAVNNGGVLPQQVLDADLQDYANGAGAVPDDQSRLSYYTSPTDLYTSDDSEPIVVPSQSSRKGMVKRELKRIMFRFSRTKTSKKTKSIQPQHVVEEGPVKDYDSFGSERGFC